MLWPSFVAWQSFRGRTDPELVFRWLEFRRRRTFQGPPSVCAASRSTVMESYRLTASHLSLQSTQNSNVSCWHLALHDRPAERLYRMKTKRSCQNRQFFLTCVKRSVSGWPRQDWRLLKTEDGLSHFKVLLRSRSIKDLRGQRSKSKVKGIKANDGVCSHCCATFDRELCWDAFILFEYQGRRRPPLNLPIGVGEGDEAERAPNGSEWIIYLHIVYLSAVVVLLSR